MPSTTLNKTIQDEVFRLAELHQIRTEVLEEFAYFVVQNYKVKAQKSKSSKSKKAKKLNRAQLQKAIYEHFKVKNSKDLRSSSEFQLATSGMDKLNLSTAADCERIYRKVIGILPDEDNEQGYGCINGINIFKYDMPWRIFGLDADKATNSDIKSAYHQLIKVYHPDNPETGDEKVFNRLTTFYKSLTYKF